MNKTIFVCAAHPDDEVLGCGGTIARHAADGDDVHVLILTRGITSRDLVAGGDSAAGEVEALQTAARRANAGLGVKTLTFADFPDNMLDTVALLHIAKEVESHIQRHTPSIVYTHDAGDMNVDHCRTSEAVSIACRPIPGQCVAELYFFEVPSSTHWRPNAQFTPNVFIDISMTLTAKLDALGEYASEMRPWPHARSVTALEHLAKWRGSVAGLAAAEAFVLARSIVKKGLRSA